MKRLIALGIVAFLVGGCIALLDRKAEIDYRIDLAEFGQLMNDVNAYLATVVDNPGILDVDESFRKEFRETLNQAKEIVAKWNGDRTLESAGSQYVDYFDTIISSMDNWGRETPSRLSIMSRDASITLSVYLRSSFLLAETR